MLLKNRNRDNDFLSENCAKNKLKKEKIIPFRGVVFFNI